MHIGDEPFAVLLGDSITRGPTPCTKQLIDVYNTYNASAISVEEIPSIRWRGTKSQLEKTEENVYKISELVEKPPRDKAPFKPCNNGQICSNPGYF